jgi:hypothetical protein
MRRLSVRETPPRRHAAAGACAARAFSLSRARDRGFPGVDLIHHFDCRAQVFIFAQVFS